MGNLGTFTKGAPLSKADISDTGNPFILYGELYTTYEEVATDIVRKTLKTSEPEQLSKIGDVIIPTSGETPEEIATATCVMTKDVVLAGDLNIYRTDKIDGRIVSYIINHVVNKDISRVAQGKSVVHIKADELAKIHINYPAECEQQKIINFLNILTARIEKQRKLINALKSYKRGVFCYLFNVISETAVFKKIGDFCTTFSGGTPKSSVYEYYNGTIPFIRSGEIHSDKTALFINEKGFNASSAKFVQSGDLLYALYGATSGDVSISKINGAINQAILCIRSSTIDVKYLAFWLGFRKNNILSAMLQGGQGNLSAELVKELAFPYTDSSRQLHLVKIIEHFNKKISSAESLLHKSEKLKFGLLQQLFI